jgi:serine/threonine protein phosphatase PrpC
LNTTVLSRLRIAARSATGARRRNEDRFLVRELTADTLLLAVADGMGGEAAGDVAAQLAIDTVAALLPGPEAEETHLLTQIETANERVLAEADRRGLSRMGTTLTVALISGNTLTWAHVGDSRLSLFRERKLRQLTLDQNAAGSMVAAGRLTPEEARFSPYRHMLEQCVGCLSCHPARGRLTLRAGDLLLLATDGLHGELSNEVIAALLGGANDLERIAQSLLDGALEQGGHDNVTVVLASF